MGSYGDKPRSRWKQRRLTRRLWLVAGLVLLTVVLSIGGFLWAFSTEVFWRRVLLPRYLGEFWHTVLTWESLEPRSMPPGVTITGLKLRDPDRTDGHVLLVGRVDVHMSFATRPWYLDVEELAIEDVDLDIELYGNGQTNYARAIKRLFDGIATDGSIRDFNDVVPAIYIHGFSARGLSFTVKDTATPDVIREFDWKSRGAIHLTMRDLGDVTNFHAGRLDRFFRLGTEGDFRVTGGQWDLVGAAEVSLTAADFKEFPNAAATLRARLTPEGSEEATVRLKTVVPLHRVPVRVRATPFEEIDLAFLREGGTGDLASIQARTFDPLLGVFDGKVRISAQWRELIAAAEKFISPEDRAPFREYLATTRIPAFDMGEQPLAIEAEANVKTSGILQYGIAAEDERRTLRLEMDGILGARQISSAGLADLREISRRGSLRGTPQRLHPLSVDLAGQLSLDEKAAQGSLWMDLSLRPMEAEFSDCLARFTLSDKGDALKPVVFRPYAADWGAALASLFEGSAKEFPRYEFAPGIEPALEALSSRAVALLESLTKADLRQARLRHSFLASGREAVAATAESLLDERLVANSLEWDISLVTPPRRDEASEWSVRGLLAGVPTTDGGPIEVSLESTFRQEALRLLSPNAELRVRNMALSSPPLSLRLTSDPEARHFVDLSNGEMALRAGLSGLTARSVAALRALGYSPVNALMDADATQSLIEMLALDAPGPRGSGLTELDASFRLGRMLEFELRTSSAGLPATQFLLDADDAIPLEKFAVGLHQRFVLDRQRGRIRSDGFALTIADELGAPAFATIALAYEQTASLDPRTLGSFLEGERQALESGVLAKPKPAWAHLVGLFDRLARLRESLAGSATFKLALPALDLARWQDALVARGLPRVDGTLELELTMPLSERARRQPLTATGTFRVVPRDGSAPASGRFTLQSRDGALEFTDFHCDLPGLAGNRMIAMTGSATVGDRASWNMKISGIDAAGLERLRTASVEPLERSLDVMRWSPVMRLADLARASMRYELTAALRETDGGATFQLDASAKDIHATPAIAGPYTIEVHQELARRDGAWTELVRHDAWLGGAYGDHVFDMALKEPADLARADVIEWVVDRELGSTRSRLLDQPLPLYEKRVVGGRLEGVFALDLTAARAGQAFGEHLPDGTLTGTITGAMLEGSDTAFDLAFSGALRQGPEQLSLDNFEMNFSGLAGEVGNASASILLSLASGDYEGSFHAAQLRGQALDPLPVALRLWSARSDANFSLSTSFAGNVATRSGLLAIEAHARALGLAPLEGVSVEAGGPHPPLQLDLAFVSEYDEPTSTILLRDFSALLREEPFDWGAAGAPDGATTAPITLASVTQALPIIYELNSLQLSGRNTEGAGLRAQLGPVDLARYRPWLNSGLGIPVQSGVLSGSGELLVRGGLATRLDSFTGSISLAGATWARAGREALKFDGTLDIDAARRANIFRMDLAELRLDYGAEAVPPLDHIRLEGFYDDTTARDSMKALITCDSLSLDRIFDYADSISRLVQRQSASTRGARDPGQMLLETAQAVDAEIEGSLHNVHFLGISLPDLSLESTLQRGVLNISRFHGLLDPGELNLRGRLDLVAPRTPWRVVADLALLDAAPWVDSFGPRRLRGRVAGRFSANVDLSAEGFARESILSSVHGDGMLKFRDIEFSGPLSRWLSTGGRPVSGECELLLRRDRVLFDLWTPWDPDRHIRARGILRNPLPTRELPGYIDATISTYLTTTVGPKWRREEYEGEWVPVRQQLFGAEWSIDGELKLREGPPIELRSLSY